MSSKRRKDEWSISAQAFIISFWALKTLFAGMPHWHTDKSDSLTPLYESLQAPHSYHPVKISENCAQCTIHGLPVPAMMMILRLSQTARYVSDGLSYMHSSTHLISYLVANLVCRHIVDVLTGLVLGLLAVNEVQALGLDLAVNKSTRKSSHDLLGLLVALGLAWCLTD